MPNLPPYSYTGPVDCSIAPNKSLLKGKSVIITGGANGMGEGFVREFVVAGAFVTIADLNEARGNALVTELGSNTCFVKCDISAWEDQVNMFKTAIANSPNKSCDIVIANAGISRAFGDSLWPLDDLHTEPQKPALTIVHVNMIGTMYTFKLAAHYFREQPDTEDRDRCLIITGSMTQYVDSPGNWEYTCTKYGIRGLMRTTRRNLWQQGMRINVISPYYVKSAIRTVEKETQLRGKGVEFALPEDCASAVMKLACDRTITGHVLNIVPRTIAGEGFVDAGVDDYQHASSYYEEFQDVSLNVSADPWK